MKRTAWVAVLALAIFAGGLYGRAIDVTSVRFAEERLPGVVNPWWEAQVNVRSVGSRAVENVKVTLTVAFKRAKEIYYFSKTETLAVVDRGVCARFYIPGDLVEAYGLPSTPENYLVELSSAEGPDEAAASAGLNAPARQKEFKTSAKNTPRSLWAHYQTPFYSQTETTRDLPAYVLP
jgi:hypothetical protein